MNEVTKSESILSSLGCGGTPAPTVQPTDKPSVQPTDQPSGHPTAQPSEFPTDQPTGQPTDQPSGQPSGYPTDLPSGEPSGKPSGLPSGFPTGIFAPITRTHLFPRNLIIIILFPYVVAAPSLSYIYHQGNKLNFL